MATRTFLALSLAAETIAKLAAAQTRLASAGASVRWVDPANLHLTLKFLGDVEDADLSEVCRIAALTAGQVEPFTFSVVGLCCAPSAGRVRMVWANVAEPNERLGWLHALLEEACAKLGLREENRRFRPHLTLGRVKGPRNIDQLRDAVAEYAEFDFGRQTAGEVIVFASELTPGGPIYTPMSAAALGGEGNAGKK